MKSSSGAHYIALDHVRALAIFMVVTWHFAHGRNGSPVPFGYIHSPLPLSLLNEGHTGVALFMTLSGYLFSKLLDGKDINYAAFLWNRALRLLPLLVVVIGLVGVQKFLHGESLSAYAYSIVRGIVAPTLPNGGWSITVEFHFYLILPPLLWLLRKSRWLPTLVVVAALALRVLVHHHRGEIQSLAYGTILGRIDQFALGMMMYQFRAYFTRRYAVALAILVAFGLLYWQFDMHGGYYKSPSYPSPRPLWIFLPTIEGLAYATGVAWYESSFSHSTAGISKFIGRIGEFSYSIYLLHIFVVFDAARFVHQRIMDISTLYLACVWSAVFLVLMVPVGYLSFRVIEAPFLRLRKPYFTSDRSQPEIATEQ